MTRCQTCGRRGGPGPCRCGSVAWVEVPPSGPQLALRLTPHEMAAVEAAARLAGMTRSAWVRASIADSLAHGIGPRYGTR